MTCQKRSSETGKSSLTAEHDEKTINVVRRHISSSGTCFLKLVLSVVDQALQAAGFNQHELNLGHSFFSGLRQIVTQVAIRIQMHVASLDQPLQKNLSSSRYTCGKVLCLEDLPTDFILFIVVFHILSFDRSELKHWLKFLFNVYVDFF